MIIAQTELEQRSILIGALSSVAIEQSDEEYRNRLNAIISQLKYGKLTATQARQLLGLVDDKS